MRDCGCRRSRGSACGWVPLGAAGARRRRAAACFGELAKPCGPSGRSNGTVAANPSQEVTAV
ncbi:hypothetical protein CN645_07130 [Burkholderia sp. IDO3]|nr:hypothetical protein DCN14_09865 [Burkholderia sp. IDO3]PCD62511.1 hypothetical protein CN645_07130 [Burkholderia sp. IDO3]